MTKFISIGHVQAARQIDTVDGGREILDTEFRRETTSKHVFFPPSKNSIQGYVCGIDMLCLQFAWHLWMLMTKLWLGYQGNSQFSVTWTLKDASCRKFRPSFVVQGSHQTHAGNRLELSTGTCEMVSTCFDMFQHFRLPCTVAARDEIASASLCFFAFGKCSHIRDVLLSAELQRFHIFPHCKYIVHHCSNISGSKSL